MFAARLTSFPALLLLTGSALSGPAFAGQALLRAASEANVNQRYTIESVSISGVQVERAKLPAGLRHRLIAMVGARCDMTAIGDMAAELRKELHLRAVNEHLSRGSQPDQIRVNFEVVKRDIAFEVSVPKFLYHSKQGFTGEVQASTHAGPNTFTLGAVSNGDDLTERYTGIVARYEDAKVFSDKVRFGIGFEDFHEQWSNSTQRAMAAGGAESGLELYRTRRGVSPGFTFVAAKSLTLSLGANFAQMKPETSGASQRSANALTADAHFAHSVEGTVQQTLDGKYSLRLGTRSLGSDYSYTRQTISFRYQVKYGKQLASDDFMGGNISGDAPFFERFVLGSSSTLRGWDRYAINPLGGTRVAHNSLSYGYQFGDGVGEVFYDSGALWNRDKGTGGVRHSLGIGYRQGIFVLTMAFPVVEGRVSPVFMAGMNY